MPNHLNRALESGQSGEKGSPATLPPFRVADSVPTGERLLPMLRSQATAAANVGYPHQLLGIGAPTTKAARNAASGKKNKSVKTKAKGQKLSTYDSWLEILVPVASILWALVLWGYSIVSINPLQMSDLGLVSVLPNTAYLAIVLLTFSFTWTLHQGRAPTWLLWFHVASFVFMIHGAPALLYDTLRYSWAWKHLGIIDYIQRYGYVDPNASSLMIYHNWPGFFSFFAYLFEVAGIKNGVALASWAPVFFNLITIGALALIFRASTNDRRLVWQGIWFYFLTNWVGQEYFSPQALNYFLHLIIIGVCLAWFRTPMDGGEPERRQHKLVQPFYDALRHLRQRAASTDAQALNAPAVQRSGLLVMMIVLFVVIATSHQLTPIVTVLAIAALVLFRRCSATSLPMLMAVMMVTWIVYGASFFVRDELFVLFKSFGTVTSNISNNLLDLSHVTLGQRVVAYAGRSLTIAVMLLALAGCLVRIRRGKWDLSLMLLAFAPFLLLLGNGYGGEVVFRVYLFALPFLAFFMASLLYPTIERGNSAWTVVANMVLSLLLFAGFNLAYYGKDQMYFFTGEEVAASEFLYEHAPANTLLIEGSRNYPSQFRNYENFTYVPLSREDPENQVNWLEDPVDVFTRWMRNNNYNAAFLVLTRSQRAEVDARLTTLPAGSLVKIEAALRASPQFSVIYSNRDAVIFTLTERLDSVKALQTAAVAKGG